MLKQPILYLTISIVFIRASSLTQVCR